MIVRDLVDNPSRVTNPQLLVGRLFSFSPGSKRGESATRAFRSVASHMATATPAADARDRRLESLGRDLSSRGVPVVTFTALTATRLITGAGGGLPDVNATVLDPVYGTPFLPASGLKGAARAAGQRLGVIGTQMERIFGHAAGEEGDAGEVRFFDGVPQRGANRVELDVATPHHSKYDQGISEWPVASEDPNPIPLLVVPARVRFRFLLAGRTSATPLELVDDAAELLTLALTDEGVGASTTMGYGYFEDITWRRRTD